MLNKLPVETAQELERFCTLAGLSSLTPEVVQRSHADAHWMLEGDDGIQARCSLWWSKQPHMPGQRVGMLGHYAATDSESAAQLLDLACAELARHDCTVAIGPMDGSTHMRYRLLSERGTHPPFFLEPDNPDDWPEHFTGNGFAALAHYYSSLQAGLEWQDPRLIALAEQFAGEGIVLRALDAGHFEDELRRIYRVVSASFQNNFLASPLSEEDFLEQNRRLQPYICPELIQIAERDGELAGFIFVIPDWLQAQRGDTLDTAIVKTLAVHPAYSGRGLATLLSGRAREVAADLGYRRAIHALMHERNVSRHISQEYQGQVIRRYTLYARTLEETI